MEKKDIEIVEETNKEVLGLDQETQTLVEQVKWLRLALNEIGSDLSSLQQNFHNHEHLPNGKLCFVPGK